MGNKLSCVDVQDACCCCCARPRKCCRSTKNKWRPQQPRRSVNVVMERLQKIGSVDAVDATTDVLKIKSVDLCIDENGRDHHTRRFELMRRDDSSGGLAKLVVRRGQKFRLKLTCNRPYNRTTDVISLILTVAGEQKPTHGHGTMAIAMLNQNVYDLGDQAEWGASVDEIHGDILEILVKAPATAPVTQWKLDIDTKVAVGDGTSSYSLPQAFYVLFNPWCPEDQVYMPDSEELEEFVMADTTLVYRGSYNRLRPSVWKLGQFERDVLDCALILISTVGKVSSANLGNPVRVARALSAAVNSPDDDGCILGNWTDDFSDGTAPTKWVGSTEILQKFYKKRKPVKFGQCWVFAGVVTTVARALGIPSRLITCYAAAHDTQASLTVDYFVDHDGKVMEEMNSDSIWNYHVWNEVFMQRPDLDTLQDTYGGWQVIDATPQEISDEMFRCGPASVKAVKMGEVLKPYDNNFVFAEVNADKVFWRYSGPAQPLKLIRKDPLGIGLFISTKAVGKWEREDITQSYKHEEKTKDERDTMLKALKQANSAFSRYYLNEDFNEVHFNFELRDDIKIGEPFTVVLHIKNRSEDKPFTVEGQLFVETTLYTGRQREPVKSLRINEELKPQISTRIAMEVLFDDYYAKLLDQAAFNISCMVSVRDTEYEYFAQDDFRVRKPDIKITLDGKPKSRQPIDVTVRLLNPLPIPLKKGMFMIEGPGFDKQLVLKLDEIPVEGTAEKTFSYTPPYSGKATIAAKFTSKELDDVDGFLAFEVRPRDEDFIMNGDPPAIVARTDVIP